jgi:hypothetical protein
MEFVEGESLTSLVEKSGALPPVRAAEMVRQAAEALTVAHEMGIVHRDLKPDNIMIAKGRDGLDLVKVVDFGIAKAAGTEGQKVTKTGHVVGTPAYMSPEQLAGDKVDGRSDIYSLALVAFNLLTGALPFPGETAQEAMLMRLTERPKSLGEMMPEREWTPEVQAVMDRALERDAKARYQTASEFGRALHTAISEMPAASEAAVGALMLGDAAMVPPTRVAWQEAVAARGRRPVLVGGAALVVAAAVAGVLVMSHARTKAAKADSALAAPPLVAANTAEAAPLARRTPAATMATNGGPSIASLLPSLLYRSAQDTTAEEALAEVEALQPRATRTSDIVGLGLARAQALGFLGRDTESCTVLRSVERSARKTPYADQIDRLLKASC